MPNIAPRGLFDSDSAAPAQEIYAVLADPVGPYLPGRYVYAYDAPGAVWRLIWAAASEAAANPAAVLEGDGTVTISWEAGDPEAADSYTVLRSDDSVVASGIASDGGPYQVSDTNPLPGTQTWTIRSDLAGVPSSEAETNSVSIDLTLDTATQSFSGTTTRSADLAWTGPKPGTASLSIYRPNGVLAATGVDPAALAWSDPAPPANIDDGQYQIDSIASSGPVGGSILATPTADLALPPPSASLSSAGPLDAATGVTVNWSAVVGEHTGFDIRKIRSTDGESNVSTAPVEDDTSYLWLPAGSNKGLITEVLVRSKINANVSPTVSAGSVEWNPDVPTAVAAVPTGVIGELTLTFAAPAEGEVTRFRVEHSDDGSIWNLTDADASSPITHTFTGGSGTRYMRVRAEGEGTGVSAWVQASAEPTWDLTPPDLPTVTSLKPESSYGRLVYRFTAAASDNHQYRRRYRVNDGSWVTSGWLSLADSESKSVVIGTFSSGNDVDVQIQVRDIWLNESAWSSSWRYKLKAATQTIAVSGLNHYRQGTWNYAGNGYAYQGYFSNPSFRYWGIIFFAASIPAACDADGTVGGKINVTSMKIRNLRRRFDIGNSLVPLYLGTTAKTSATGTYDDTDIDNVSDMGDILNQNTEYDITLTQAQRNALRDGDRSLGLTRNSTQYLALDQVDDIQITSLG